MNDLLEMIKTITIQEAIALTVEEDMEEVIAQIEQDFKTMSEDDILEIGLNNSYISIEDIDTQNDVLKETHIERTI